MDHLEEKIYIFQEKPHILFQFIVQSYGQVFNNSKSIIFPYGWKAHMCCVKVTGFWALPERTTVLIDLGCVCTCVRACAYPLFVTEAQLCDTCRLPKRAPAYCAPSRGIQTKKEGRKGRRRTNVTHSLFFTLFHTPDCFHIGTCSEEGNTFVRARTQR